MLFVFEMDGKVMVSDLDPDTEDFEKVLSNSFVASVPGKKLTAEFEIGIVRNVLTNGGASVTMK